MTYTATYSPEDNKLRLYSSSSVCHRCRVFDTCPGFYLLCRYPYLAQGYARKTTGPLVIEKDEPGVGNERSRDECYMDEDGLETSYSFWTT
jgi:hypothetical protein